MDGKRESRKSVLSACFDNENFFTNLVIYIENETFLLLREQIAPNSSFNSERELVLIKNFVAGKKGERGKKTTYLKKKPDKSKVQTVII